MRVATWNVNGMRARQAQFLEWVEQAQPDVICTQEIKARRDQLAFDILDLPGYVSCWHCAGPYSGVSINLRRETFGEDPEFAHPSFDRDTRVVEARLGNTTFASIYVPNGGKDFADKVRFLDELRLWVGEQLAAGRNLVLCGDMNVTRTDMDVHFSERSPKSIGQRPDERSQFEDLLDQGLVDVARVLHPDDDAFFTWWAPWRNHKQRNVGWRIDYILASDAFAQRVRECAVQREVGASDHGPLIATFADPE